MGQGILHICSRAVILDCSRKGGNAVWGNATHAPDDDHPNMHSHGELIAFRDPESVSTESTGAIKNNLTVGEAEAWILGHTSSAFQVPLIPGDMSNFSSPLQYRG